MINNIIILFKYAEIARTCQRGSADEPANTQTFAGSGILLQPLGEREDDLP